MPSVDEIFRSLISLVGKEVEVGLRSSGEKLNGTVSYTMFDSFLLKTTKGKRVISFSDILYLDPA
jgi:hypothetical protein